jgi:hypothetical protein
MLRAPDLSRGRPCDTRQCRPVRGWSPARCVPLAVDQEVGGSSPPSCTSYAPETINIWFWQKNTDNHLRGMGKHQGSTY